MDMLTAIDTSVSLGQFAGPGGYNDPDMLLGSNPQSAVYLTPVQSRSQFSMWRILAAPLLLGTNVRNLTAFDRETYTNKEVNVYRWTLLK